MNETISYITFIISALTLLVNPLVVFVIPKKRQLLERKSNVFMLFLFLCYTVKGIYDFIFAVCIITTESKITTTTFGSVHFKLNFPICSLQFFAIAGLSGDRLLAIKYPMLYLRMDNTCLLIYAMACILILVGIVTTDLFTSYTVASVVFSTFCIITAVFVCISNLIIRQIIQKKFRKVGDRKVTATKKQKAVELNKTRICLVLAFSFLFFWIPYNVIAMVSIYVNHDLRNAGSIITSFVHFSSILSILNSFVDPVFYIFQSKKLRNEIKECICGVSVHEIDERSSKSVDP